MKSLVNRWQRLHGLNKPAASRRKSHAHEAWRALTQLLSPPRSHSAAAPRRCCNRRSTCRANIAAAPATTSEPEVAWWESFGDPVLSELIRRAARENRDVKIAAERVRAARAGETISRSWLMPSIGARRRRAISSTGYDWPSRKQAVPDIEGRRRRPRRVLGSRPQPAACARAPRPPRPTRWRPRHGVRGVRLLVLSDVATNYFTLVGALRQLETVRAISAAQDETLRLVTARQRVGLATPFDVERAQTDAASARAAIPPLETLAAVSRHRIAVLIGDQAANAASIVPWTRRRRPCPTPQPGQPAALLQRRPDLLALEAQLEAANARRQQAAGGVVPAALPRARCSAASSVELNGVGLGAARFTNVAGAADDADLQRGPHAGDQRDRRERPARSAAALRGRDRARARGRRERAGRASATNGSAREALQSAAASADAALGRAQSLYDRGQIDLLPLLDAQRARLAVRVSANDSNTQLLLDSVQLYKALGGGWQAFEPAAAEAPTPSPRIPEPDRHEEPS